MANHLDMILALEIDVKMECKLALKIDANMQRARLDRAARSEGVGFGDGVYAQQEARCVAKRSLLHGAPSGSRRPRYNVTTTWLWWAWNVTRWGCKSSRRGQASKLRPGVGDTVDVHEKTVPRGAMLPLRAFPQQITVVVPVLEWLVVQRIKFLLCATTWTHNMIRRADKGACGATIRHSLCCFPRCCGKNQCFICNQNLS